MRHSQLRTARSLFVWSWCASGVRFRTLRSGCQDRPNFSPAARRSVPCRRQRAWPSLCPVPSWPVAHRSSSAALAAAVSCWPRGPSSSPRMTRRSRPHLPKNGFARGGHPPPRSTSSMRLSSSRGWIYRGRRSEGAPVSARPVNIVLVGMAKMRVQLRSTYPEVRGLVQIALGRGGPAGHHLGTMAAHCG
jgi:hypothetical protein